MSHLPKTFMDVDRLTKSILKLEQEREEAIHLIGQLRGEQNVAHEKIDDFKKQLSVLEEKLESATEAMIDQFQLKEALHQAQQDLTHAKELLAKEERLRREEQERHDLEMTSVTSDLRQKIEEVQMQKRRELEQTVEEAAKKEERAEKIFEERLRRMQEECREAITFKNEVMVRMKNEYEVRIVKVEEELMAAKRVDEDVEQRQEFEKMKKFYEENMKRMEAKMEAVLRRDEEEKESVETAKKRKVSFHPDVEQKLAKSTDKGTPKPAGNGTPRLTGSGRMGDLFFRWPKTEGKGKEKRKLYNGGCQPEEF